MLTPNCICLSKLLVYYKEERGTDKDNSKNNLVTLYILKPGSPSSAHLPTILHKTDITDEKKQPEA